MCIGKKICCELGDNPEYWSTQSPLPPPLWFDDEVTKFSEAVHSAATGDLQNARTQLALVRSDDLREWFGEHAQQAGLYRCRHFGGRHTNAPILALDPLRDTRRHEPFVYERDGYRCRYCSCRVVPGVVFRAFSNVIGADAFGISGRRSQRHGAAVALKACADHVLPHFLGGRTNPDNLVTACWGCNFGKNYYTVEEIGIENPLSRFPQITSDWDGLMSLVPKLQQPQIKPGKQKPRKGIDEAGPKRRIKRTPGETAKGIGGVSIPVLYCWMREWEENNGQPPANWTRFRVSFFLKNLELIKAQTKGFKP